MMEYYVVIKNQASETDQWLLGLRGIVCSKGCSGTSEMMQMVYISTMVMVPRAHTAAKTHQPTYLKGR